MTSNSRRAAPRLNCLMEAIEVFTRRASPISSLPVLFDMEERVSHVGKFR